MSRTLAQINKELSKYYASDRTALSSQLAALPGQSAAEISGLDAKLTQANDNILSGARARGVGFSGMPIQEQAQYAATDYAPAVARVKQSQNERAGSISSALNGLARDQYSQARGVYDNERNYGLQQAQFKESQRQFNENLKLQREQAASAGGGGAGAGAGDYLSSLFSGGGGGGTGTAKGPQAVMTQRKDKGFNFTIGGKAVSAATYAKATGIPFRTLLKTMGNKDDEGAKQALQFVGNDFGYDPRKVNASIYNSLAWGSGRTAKAPKKASRANPSPIGAFNAYYGGGAPA